MHALYRSHNFGKAAARQLGSVHFHIDCPNARDAESELVLIARRCEANGWPSKVTRIVTAKSGGHITNPEFVRDYSLHTPELQSVDATFTAYLTALLGEECRKPDVADELCEKVKEFFADELGSCLSPDTVIEIERVAARLDNTGFRFATPMTLDYSKRGDSAPFEVHHFADLPVTCDVTFEDWARTCMAADVTVGGWFQFNRPSERSFRSVRFARSLDRTEIFREFKAVSAIATQVAGVEARTETVVEQILAIWRI